MRSRHCFHSAKTPRGTGLGEDSHANSNYAKGRRAAEVHLYDPNAVVHSEGRGVHQAVEGLHSVLRSFRDTYGESVISVAELRRA